VLFRSAVFAGMRGLYFDVLCPVRPASDPEGCVGGVSVFWAFGEFRRPGGEFLFHVEKEPKDAGGRRRGELRSPMTAFPQTPITGDAYLMDFAKFPARRI